MLHLWGFLNTRMTECFADALWERVDDTGFPKDTDFSPHEFLALPHPAGITPARVFKKWVRSQQFPVQENAVSFQIGWQYTLCTAIIGANENIEWTEDEVHSIVHRLASWWDADKELMRHSKATSWNQLIVNRSRRNFSDLVATLVSVVSPRFNPAEDSDTRLALERLIREIDDRGLSALSLETACLHLFPEKRDSVLQRIEVGMASSAEERVEDALRAVSILSERIYVRATKREREDLIRILGVASQMLRWRKRTGLRLVIDLLTEVINLHPWSFSGTVESSVLEGLHHMIGDSAIRAPSRTRNDRNRDGSDIAKKLIMRRAAARLAYTASIHYARRRDPVPEVIKEWESICRSDDEFAEIRNEWLV